MDKIDIKKTNAILLLCYFNCDIIQRSLDSIFENIIKTANSLIQDVYILENPSNNSINSNLC